MSLSQFLIVIKSRYRIALAILGVTVLLTLIISLAMPKRYTAITHVVIDLLSQDLVGGAGAALSANSSASYIPTQVEIITSTGVAQRVVKKLNLDRDPLRHDTWLRESGGRGNEVAWIARELQKQLVVKPALDSNILAISFRSADAAFSAAVANAYAAAYIETTVDLKDGPARDTAEWLDGRVKEAREMLGRAQARVIDYQKAHLIVTSDERYDSETERLNLLSQQLVTLQAQNAEAKAKLEAGTANGMMRDVAQDATILKIRGDISDLTGKMSEAAASFGRNHPNTVQMRVRLAALQADLERETARVSSAIAGDSAAGAVREESFIAAISAQKERLINLKAQRAELDQLVKDRDAAQAAYQDLSQKYIQTHLLAHSVQTNVSVLAPAFEPLKPSSPLPVLYLLISVVVGTLLGIAAAFACEIKDRRVRSEEDIASILGTAALGGRSRQAGRSVSMRLASWSNGGLGDRAA